MNIEIQWRWQYSQTMEPDDKGRWMRIASVMHKDSMLGFVNEAGRVRRAIMDVAWITLVRLEGQIYFAVLYDFPQYDTPRHFATLDEAKQSVSERLSFFLKCCGVENDKETTRR